MAKYLDKIHRVKKTKEGDKTVPPKKKDEPNIDVDSLYES